jgi:hypothetical protein
MINFENLTDYLTGLTDYLTDVREPRTIRHPKELSVSLPVRLPVRLLVIRVMSLLTGKQSIEHVRPSLRE